LTDLNVLMIDGIDISTIAIMWMLMISQPSTSMAPSTGDDDTIDYVSMAAPYPYCAYIYVPGGAGSTARIRALAKLQ
jgi:hypothetical protein